MFWRKKKWEPIFQSDSTTYPTGTCVKSGNYHYFIKGGTKFKIPTERVLDSWKFNSIAHCHIQVMKPYKFGGALGFRDGTIIENIANKKMYLISGSKKRLITSPDVFDKYGYNRANVVEVSHEEAELHRDGEDLK